MSPDSRRTHVHHAPLLPPPPTLGHAGLLRSSPHYRHMHPSNNEATNRNAHPPALYLSLGHKATPCSAPLDTIKILPYMFPLPHPPERVRHPFISRIQKSTPAGHPGGPIALVAPTCQTSLAGLTCSSGSCCYTRLPSAAKDGDGNKRPRKGRLLESQ